jgi:hypothetical protein
MRAFVIVVLGLFSLACSGGGADPSGSSAAQPKTSKRRTLSPEEGLQIIQGCCAGSGGTFSPAGQDCVIDPSAADGYAGCVGTFDVLFESGNTQTIRGRDTVRELY